MGATSAGGQARVIAYAYGNADLKKLNEATVLASRQAGQVNELERDRAHVDSVDQTEVVGVLVAPAANANELLLTAGDCMFLLEVGIRP